QQGHSNSVSADKYSKTAVDVTIENFVDAVEGTENVTVTLPENPYAGQRHIVAASPGKTVTVIGAAFPAGPQTVVGGANGFSRHYLYLGAAEKWIEDCCETAPTNPQLTQTLE